MLSMSMQIVNGFENSFINHGIYFYIVTFRYTKMCAIFYIKYIDFKWIYDTIEYIILLLRRNIYEKIFTIIVPFLMIFFLVACDSSRSQSDQNQNSETTIVQSLDLTGNWKQINSNSETSYQSASIEKDTIEVYWVNTENDTKSLYWSGTYIAPDVSENSVYSWDSENNVEKTKSSLLASNSATKKFSYENGILSYEATAMGTTQTVKLEKMNN